MSINKIIVILFVCFVGLYLFYLYFPLILVGPPTSLFYIKNNEMLSHDVIVEIFNEQNISVFKKTYLLDSYESVSLDREIQWWLPFPQTFVTWSDGVITFNITVDYEYSKEIIRNTNQYETVIVDVFNMQYPKVLTPIEIRIATV